MRVCGRRTTLCEVSVLERKELATWFGDVAEKEKSDFHILADYFANTIVNLATAFGFISRMCSLE